MSRKLFTDWQLPAPPDEMDYGGESGASSAEYAVLLSCIVIIGIIGYITLSGQMNRIFSMIAF